MRRRRSDSTDSSVQAWKYRLKLFVEWAEGIGIERVEQIRGYDLDEYFELRSSEIAPATLEGEMWTLKKFVEYLEQLGAVDDGLAESVRIPDLDKEDRTDDVTYAATEALPQLQFYRNSRGYRATREHVFLELAWYTGARQGGLRALDVRDVDLERNYVEFHHRPETDTPLKNKQRGERPVAIPPVVGNVIGEYIDDHRYDVRDDHGRQPLLASARGRPGTNTLRVWSYLATQPCRRISCPHGKVRERCKWTEYAHASKCPSSRSPHKIRAGSITWQLNRGIPPEVVADRVNATQKVIYDHYDWASEEQRWRRFRENMERRRDHLEKLDSANYDN
nr:site-specific integrase [Halopiger goleimassiliensis]